MGPPSRKSPQEEGIPPHPPFLGVSERARDLEKWWVYREQGKARCIFTAKG